MGRAEHAGRRLKKDLSMAKILVTGGCGFIGSHTLVSLIESGFEVLSADNLVNSDEKILEGVKQITAVTVKNYRVDLCDIDSAFSIFRENSDISGVIHFAALKHVGEFEEQSLRYFRNNLSSLINLLECMQRHGVQDLIFSSSCSVYGNAKTLPVTEHTPLGVPQSVYARTKQMGEQIISDVSRTYPKLRSVLLRYFNPAGAHVSARIGEAPTNLASNLVPVITETVIGRRNNLTVFGSDYETRDGSCVRDYIHVMDLAEAHLKALRYLMDGKNRESVEVFNLGIGDGVTVLEAIEAFQSATGQSVDYRLGGRRAGDVVAIYANSDKAAQTLGWKPVYNIQDIMRTAWEWEKVRRGSRISAPIAKERSED